MVAEDLFVLTRTTAAVPTATADRTTEAAVSGNADEITLNLFLPFISEDQKNGSLCTLCLLAVLYTRHPAKVNAEYELGKL